MELHNAFGNKNSDRCRAKAKAIKYLKTISLPGIPQIMTTQSKLSKLLLTLLTVHSLLFCSRFREHHVCNRGLPKVRHDHKHRNSHAQNLRFPAIMVCNYLGYDISHYKNGSEIGEVWPSPHQYNVSRISHFLISATFHSTWENNTDMIDLDSNMSNHFNHSSDYSVC